MTHYDPCCVPCCKPCPKPCKPRKFSLKYKTQYGVRHIKENVACHRPCYEEVGPCICKYTVWCPEEVHKDECTTYSDCQ